MSVRAVVVRHRVPLYLLWSVLLSTVVQLSIKGHF